MSLGRYCTWDLIRAYLLVLMNCRAGILEELHRVAEQVDDVAARTENQGKTQIDLMGGFVKHSTAFLVWQQSLAVGVSWAYIALGFVSLAYIL